MFQVTAFHLDTSMQTSLPLTDCVPITRWSSLSHADTMHPCSSYKVKVAQ